MSAERQMPYKRLVIILGIVLMLFLMIFANITESPAESISGGSTSTPAGLEKNLPTEERIPTH